MSDAGTIESEDAFQMAMPRHANAIFSYVESDPAMKVQRWAFARAIVRPPDLASVLFVAISGKWTEVWLSIAPNGEGGWSIVPVTKGTAGE